jgi:uncharacterized integral membrane protein
MRLRAVVAASASPIQRQRRHHRRARPPVAARNGGNTSSKPVYDGVHSPWSMEPSDLVEVYGYRACLAAASLCGAAAAAELLLPSPPPLPSLDALLSGGALSLGAALVLIHVYVTPLKRFVQLLWLLGVGGCLYVHWTAAGEAAAAADGAAATAATATTAVLSHVATHPLWDTLFVGPLAAAATGVAVKEGFCFRRPEAAALALLLPALCLTHLLSGAWPSAAGVVPLFGGATALAAVALAAGKVAQDPKDDVG